MLEDEDDIGDAPLGPPVPIPAAVAAEHLCQVFEDIDHPTAADIDRWSYLIRTWRYRYPDQIRQYGTPGRQLYLLPELFPFAKRWRRGRRES